jgi:hypothetical protein
LCAEFHTSVLVSARSHTRRTRRLTSGEDDAEYCHVRIRGDNINNIDSVPAEEDDEENNVEDDREDEVAEGEIEERADSAGDRVYICVYASEMRGEIIWEGEGAYRSSRS